MQKFRQHIPIGCLPPETPQVSSSTGNPIVSNRHEYKQHIPMGQLWRAGPQCNPQPQPYGSGHALPHQPLRLAHPRRRCSRPRRKRGGSGLPSPITTLSVVSSRQNEGMHPSFSYRASRSVPGTGHMSSSTSSRWATSLNATKDTSQTKRAAARAWQHPSQPPQRLPHSLKNTPASWSPPIPSATCSSTRVSESASNGSIFPPGSTTHSTVWK